MVILSKIKNKGASAKGPRNRTNCIFIKLSFEKNCNSNILTKINRAENFIKEKMGVGLNKDILEIGNFEEMMEVFKNRYKLENLPGQPSLFIESDMTKMNRDIQAHLRRDIKDQ